MTLNFNFAWNFWANIFFAKNFVLTTKFNFFITNLNYLLGLVYPENLSSIGLKWIFGWFGGFWPPFCAKNIFLLRVVFFSIPNLNHLLRLTNHENLSSIGLMVEAVDTFCGTGTGRDGHGTGRARDGWWLYRQPQPKLLLLTWPWA